MAAPASPTESVAAYKRMLAEILDRRPSGTRQRLAAAIGKNRSFVSQITNPAYATPVPATHLDVIFEVSHFSAEERQRFIRLYGLAHPQRHAAAAEPQRLKPHTLYLPDLGDDGSNEQLHNLVADFTRRLCALFEDQPKKGKRK